jgi:hypothetical protein
VRFVVLSVILVVFSDLVSYKQNKLTFCLVFI